jgi:CHAT domain-containing protein
MNCRFIGKALLIASLLAGLSLKGEQRLLAQGGEASRSSTLSELLAQGSANDRQVSRDRRVALVIGNAAYSQGKLENPVNDATDIAAALRQRGFEVTLVTDANLKEMDVAVDQFFAELKQSKVGRFYYAGHGMQLDGLNYLTPLSANIRIESDVRSETLPVEQVLNRMRIAGNEMNIVILDACRDDPFPRSSRSSQRGLAALGYQPPGLVVSYSTAPGQVAADGEGRRNSPYAHALLERLETSTEQVEGFFNQVSLDVIEATDGQQVPYKTSAAVPEFSFNPRQSVTAPSQTASPLESVSASSQRVARAFQTATDTYANNVLQAVSQHLKNVSDLMNINPAILVVEFVPPPGSVANSNPDDWILQVRLIVPSKSETVDFSNSSDAITVTSSNVTRRQVFEAGNDFFNEVISFNEVSHDPNKSDETTYRTFSGQLYDWWIRPLEPALKEAKISSLSFILPEQLRLIPIAALYDTKEQKFLVQKSFDKGRLLSLSLMPHIIGAGTIPTVMEELRHSRVLAMGTEVFPAIGEDIPEGLTLPGIPLELRTIAQLWNADIFENEQFTINNLKAARNRTEYKIVHLATVAYSPGSGYLEKPEDYGRGSIRFTHELLGLNLQDWQNLELDRPSPGLDLLVLSACETVYGDGETGFGFAGLALQSGAKSVLAASSITSDLGTVGLMTAFYSYLKDPDTHTKAEALQRAQLAMINGDVIELSGLSNDSNSNFSHPFFWATYTMFGSPW